MGKSAAPSAPAAKRAKLADCGPAITYDTSAERLLEAVVAAGGEVCDGISFQNQGGAGIGRVNASYSKYIHKFKNNLRIISEF